MVQNEAVKLYLHSPEGAIYVKNSRDKLTLPGGGIEPGEDHFDALERETEEELGYRLSDAATTPVYLGEHKFIAPDRHGKIHRRLWHIYGTATDFVPSDFMHDDDIYGVVGLRREEIHASRAHMLESAYAASRLALRSIQLLQRSHGRGGHQRHSELFPSGLDSQRAQR